MSKKTITVEVYVECHEEVTREGKVKIEVGKDDFDENGVLKLVTLKNQVDSVDLYDCTIHDQHWDWSLGDPPCGWPDDWNVLE